MPISFPDPEYCLAFSLESKELLLLSTFNCLNWREEKFRDISAKHAVGPRLALELGLRLYKASTLSQPQSQRLTKLQCALKPDSTLATQQVFIAGPLSFTNLKTLPGKHFRINLPKLAYYCKCCQSPINSELHLLSPAPPQTKVIL